MTSPTGLTETQLAELRTRAAGIACGFVDPTQLRRVEQFVTGRNPWASAILGKPFALRAMTNRDLVLLDLAAHAEPTPPEPPRAPAPWEPGYQPTEGERAATARSQAAARAWLRLVTALPVPVSVAYNYSGPHHYEFHVSGANHIIVREPLHAGRIHRHADRSLCWTPSRAQHLLFAYLDDPVDRDRVPTCKACLRIAYRVAGLTPVEDLLPR